MKFKCEIDNLKTLKKGMKITLAIDDKNTISVMKDIYNFMDKPLEVELNIDSAKEVERLKQITPDQRRKIFAIIGDIAKFTNQNKEGVREEIEQSFMSATGHDEFSLSNCSNELAGEYIEYLIRLCFEMGIPLAESPAEGLNDIEGYLKICIEQKKCCVCGRHAEIHHVDVIGMGRDRQTYDDSKHRKMALCRKHHTEAGQIGQDVFDEKYHVYGVIVDG